MSGYEDDPNQLIGYEEQRQRDIERERESWAAITNLIDQIVDLSRDAYRWGDGAGGAITARLADQLNERYGSPEPPPRQRPPKHTRAHVRLHTIAERDGWGCSYCGKALSCPCGTGEPAVADHVMPRARGGADDLVNLVLACWECNSSKGDRTPSEWGGPR